MDQEIEVRFRDTADRDRLLSNLRMRKRERRKNERKSALRAVAMRRRHKQTYKLRLQQILELELDRGDGHSHVRRRDFKHANVVRADGQADLVELLGRVLVDGEEDPAIVERLRRVLVRAKLVMLARLL